MQHAIGRVERPGESQEALEGKKLRPQKLSLLEIIWKSRLDLNPLQRRTSSPFLIVSLRLLRVFKIESIATQWVFTTVSLANLFCGCFCWALAPFAVCFAVLWVVRRKSGWGICVLPSVFGGLCFGFYDLPRCMLPPVSMQKSS